MFKTKPWKWLPKALRGGAAPAVDPSVGLEDVPRYPPFAKGLPVADVAKVVGTQIELATKIRASLGFNAEEFSRFVAPVITRYAEFVHLLPASESHHHRGAGGLFRHGLEVAFWSAQASQSIIFSMSGTPRERRDNDPKWRLACCFAGLLHDVGKPLSDVAVTDRDGGVTWNPYANSLYGWSKQNGISRYFLRWRDKRHKRHENFSLLAIERILPPEVLEYLSSGGPEILEAMLEAIAGTGTHQPVTRVMLKADQESVARDLKQSRFDGDEYAYGVPVERYVFDAIRRLVKTGKWRTNEPGGQVWRTADGVFVVWKGLGDLYALIEKDEIPGIPRDIDTLADILIERGYAIPQEYVETSSGEIARYRYWELAPEILQKDLSSGSIRLMCLRLESAELVFTTEPPPAIEGKLIGQGGKKPLSAPGLVEADEQAEDETPPRDEAITSDDAVAEQQGNGQSELESAGNNKADPPPVKEGAELSLADIMGNDGSEFPFQKLGMNQPSSGGEKVTAEPGVVDSDPPPVSGKMASKKLQDDKEPPKDDEKQKPKAEPPAPTLSVLMKGGPLSGGVKTDTSKGSSALKSLAAAAQKEDVASKKKQPQKPKVAPAGNSSQNKVGGRKPTAVGPISEETDRSARQKLNDYLQTLEELKVVDLVTKAITPVLQGEVLLGRTIALIKGDMAILYPDGAKELGKPKSILDCLSKAGLIKTDPIVPGKKIQEHLGHKGIVLTDPLSSLMIRAIEESKGSSESLHSLLEEKPVVTRKTKKATSAPKADINVPEKSAKPSPVKAKPESSQSERPAKTLAVPPVARKAKTGAPKPAADVATPSSSAMLASAADVTPLADSDFEGLLPPDTPETVVQRLRDMIIKRQGQWLVDQVSVEGGHLVTSDKALAKAAKDSDMSKHELAGALVVGTRLGITKKQGKLYVSLESKQNEA